MKIIFLLYENDIQKGAILNKIINHTNGGFNKNIDIENQYNNHEKSYVCSLVNNIVYVCYLSNSQKLLCQY